MMGKKTIVDIDIKKEAFIKAYQNNFGNVTQSVDAVGVTRSAYYKWVKDDPKFLAKLEAVEPKEIKKDFIETALMRKIREGDTAAIIFASKTQLKDRGYIERQELTGADGDKLGAFTVEIINGATAKDTNQ
jgi:hypothetical protein